MGKVNYVIAFLLIVCILSGCRDDLQEKSAAITVNEQNLIQAMSDETYNASVLDCTLHNYIVPDFEAVYGISEDMRDSLRKAYEMD